MLKRETFNRPYQDKYVIASRSETPMWETPPGQVVFTVWELSPVTKQGDQFIGGHEGFFLLLGVVTDGAGYPYGRVGFRKGQDKASQQAEAQRIIAETFPEIGAHGVPREDQILCPFDQIADLPEWEPRRGGGRISVPVTGSSPPVTG